MLLVHILWASTRPFPLSPFPIPEPGRVGGWWLVCMPCPSPPPYAPRPPGPGGGGGGGSSGWLVLIWGVLCAVCRFSAVPFTVADVKYPCSCVASFPFPSHHLGLALGGVLVLFPAPLGHRRSETSSGLECVASSPVPSHHLGSALGGVAVLFPAPLGHRRSETSSGLEFPFLLWKQTNL